MLGAVLLLGGLLRAAYLREAAAEPDFGSPAVDAAFHDYWACAIAAGDWTPPAGRNDPQIPSNPYLRPPGYPLFLAAVYRLSGCDMLAARLCQIGLGLLNCALVFALAGRWCGLRAGLLAALLTATCWTLVYFEMELVEVLSLIHI